MANYWAKSIQNWSKKAKIRWKDQESKKKPFFIATGASTIKEVSHAVSLLKKVKANFCLMQCNTNYTGSNENFKYINLNVLNTYRKKFPNITAELSFETPNYKVHAGRFKDKIKGLKTLDTLKRIFPSAFLLVKKKP